MYKQIIDCRLCSGAKLIEVLNLGTQSLTGLFPKTKSEDVPAGPLALMKCLDCGLVQLAHNYTLSMLYGDTYGYRSGLNLSMVRHLQAKVAAIEGMLDLRPDDLVLDIGSNDGTLLKSYNVEGLRRVGIDPSGEKFRQYYDSGTELIPDFFSSEAVFRHVGQRKARVITSISMFYDLERPLEFANQIMEVLEDEGVWVFEQSYLPSMVATHSYDTVCHEHLEYYALKQIAYLTAKVGLKIVSVEMNDVNGGSFSLTVAKRQSKYPEATQMVEQILAAEKAAGYDTTAPLDDLKNSMLRHRNDLRELLQTLSREGKKVFGYGASTKGNVVLQYCGITPDLLPYIAEVNEDKFGSYTPGTKIPIISEAEARAMKPDYFMVLPWHFRQGIVLKEGPYLEQGGHLIFPLPVLEVVSADAPVAAT
ncbi:MAG: class I SAM-dependent methyltransferase [Bryobacteraceae bacterium]